jgi:hypothetical protein
MHHLHPTPTAAATSPLAAPPIASPQRPASITPLDWAAWTHPDAASNAAHAAWLADTPMSWLVVAHSSGALQ